MFKISLKTANYFLRYEAKNDDMGCLTAPSLAQQRKALESVTEHERPPVFFLNASYAAPSLARQKKHRESFSPIIS